MLKLESVKKETKVLINDTEVTVYGSISTITKHSIIKAALDESMVINNMLVPNRLLFDATLYSLIVVSYTDIEIEDMSIIKTIDLFDIFESNGVIETVLKAIKVINHNEIETLLSYADTIYNEYLTTLNSAKTGLVVASEILLEKLTQKTKK